MKQVTKESVKSDGQTAAIHFKESQKEQDQKMVKGIFRCFEPRGGSALVPYRRYKDEPIRTYKMRDGEIYEIPLGLARHLRDNCNYIEHEHKIDEKGNPWVDKNARALARMTFEPLVMDIDGRFYT